jgi:hypothetical protein
MKTKQLFVSVMMGLGLLMSAASFAATPECVDDQGNLLPLNDAQAIAYKTNTPNGSTSRVHVSGPITQVYAIESGHNHFEISLGNASGDTLEVVYNISFGALPALKTGMKVEVCGDFINSYAPENGYQASPDGTIVHWIHKTDSKNHPAGFTIVNGVLYGQGNGSGS